MTSPFIQQIADNRVCQVLTCLPEKFVVDFANGIDVAQEHIRTAGERTFFRRLKEGLTGEGAARQNAINASVAQGLEASLRWLTELTTSLATTNYAITRVFSVKTGIPPAVNAIRTSPPSPYWKACSGKAFIHSSPARPAYVTRTAGNTPNTCCVCAVTER